MTVVYSHTLDCSIDNISISIAIFNTQQEENPKPPAVDQLFMQELMEKITENNNNLPPPIFTKKCCEYYKKLDKVNCNWEI